MRRAWFLLLCAACTPTSGTGDSPDAGRTAAHVDASVRDASTPDADRPDAALADAALPDAWFPDAALGDAAVPDAAAPDASVPDAAPPDAAVPDAGLPSGPGLPFAIVGFGAAAVGGFVGGADTYTVTSLDDDGPGTLREGLRASSPRLILFAVDGTIPLTSALIVPSHVTLDGRGHAITLEGKGLVVPGSDDVIITHITLHNVGPDSEDGLQVGSVMDPSENVVVDHVSFLQDGDNGSAENVDEAISVVWGARNITVQWCRFERWEKVILAGNGDAPAELDALISVTFHHNVAIQTGRRHPQARHGRYDFFNNVLLDWHMYGPWFLAPYPESFGAQIQDNGQLRFEHNMVSRRDTAFDSNLTTANHVTRCESGGALLENGTWVAPESTSALEFGVGCMAGAAVFGRPYAADVQVAGDALMQAVLAGAGARP